MISYDEFISTIFCDLQDDEMVLVSKQPNLDGGFINGNVKDGSRWVNPPRPSAVYVSIGTVRPPENLEDMPRRRKADVVNVYAVVLDDIGTKVQANTVPVQPSWKIETSLGSFQWGYLLEPTSDRERFEAFVTVLGERGYTDKGAEGCNRLVRVPGSVNIKPGRDRFAARIVEWEPDRAWTLESLMEAFGVTEADIQTAKKPARIASATGAAPMANIDPVVDWLHDTGRIVEDRGEWVDIRCPWHEAHTTGADTASYSPLGRGTERWVQSRGFSCLHEHCKDKSYSDFNDWVVAQGGPAAAVYDPLPWLQSRYVFVVNGSEVVDLEARKNGGVWRLSLTDWANAYAGKIPVPGQKRQIPIKDAFLKSPDTRRAVFYTYLPGGSDLLEINGQTLVNEYTEPNWVETDRSPDVFLEHVEFLLPKAEERELFLDWLAFKIQNPALRSYAILMVADNAYGTGRSWLRQILTLALQGKVKTATLPQLIGKGSQADKSYNDWATGCQFLIVEEARDSASPEDFFRGYETFKSFVDTRPVSLRVNPKYGKTRDDILYFNCLMFSNHVDALVLPEEDRRVCVLTNPTERRDLAYYERLEGALHAHSDEARRVYFYLKRRDVSKFDHVYPPMTQAKRDLLDAVESPAEVIKRELQERAPSDIVTVEYMRRTVGRIAQELGFDQISAAPGGTARRIWRMLGTLRQEDRKNGARYVVGGVQQEFRALKNREYWIERDKDRDKRAFEGEYEKLQSGATVPTLRLINNEDAT